MGFEPMGGFQMEGCLSPGVELRPEKVGKEAMIAIPLPPGIQGDEE